MQTPNPISEHYLQSHSLKHSGEAFFHGEQDSQPLFSGSLHLALGDAGDAKQCEVDGGWQGRYLRGGFF